MKKYFLGQNLCSGAFGGNIRPYTKQRARHGTPFLEPPPPPSPGAHAIPPPQSNFRAAQRQALRAFGGRGFPAAKQSNVWPQPQRGGTSNIAMPHCLGTDTQSPVPTHMHRSGI